MTIVLELPLAVEEAIAHEARQRGMTPEQVLVEDARLKYDGTSNSPGPQQDWQPTTGADLIAIWRAEGAFLPPTKDAAADLDSSELARQIRHEAEHARDYLWKRS